MDALGYHFLIELYECDRELLKNAKFLEDTLRNVVKKSGATEIGAIFHQFSPQGVSGVILISESHYSIHTWPERGYAAVDFFTCNARIDAKLGYQLLIQALKPKTSSILEIKRGINA